MMIIKQRINKMKKELLLKIILLLSLVTPKLFADITQEQLDEYMKISRGGQVLDYYKRNIVKGFARRVEIKHRDVVMNQLTTILNNKEVLEKFNKNFKDLNETIYYEIMKFYNTEEGKKSVKSTTNFSTINKKEMEDILRKCKINHTKDCLKNIDLSFLNTLSKSKKILLKKVTHQFDVIKIKRVFSKQSMLSMNLIYKKEYQYSNEFIERYSTRDDLDYNETTSKISYFVFKNFSEDELIKIVAYALSDAGEEEYKLIEEGIISYTNEAIKEILLFYYPSKCIVLSKRPNRFLE